MPTYIITGANRGLGLEFVGQLSTASSNILPNTILALVRSTSKSNLSDLNTLSSSASQNGSSITIHECDTSSVESIHKFTSSLDPSTKIDVLINNAGINDVPEQNALTFDGAEMHRHLDTNVIGPAELAKRVLPLMAEGGVIFNMTSGLGSFGKGIFGDGKTVYAVSKAGLDMYSCHLAVAEEVKNKKVRVLVMDPGWCQTDMGGKGAVLEPKVSVEGMLGCVERVRKGEKGEVGRAVFLQYDGEAMPW